MNIKAISRNTGFALLVSALFMFLSLIVSVCEGRDSAFTALNISFLITAIVGGFPLIFVRKSTDITLSEGYITIVLSWLLSFVFGMLPYALWGGPFNLQNAWFESVSGFTTTGATILSDVEALPRSLLFWRSSTHFIGGLGVVVFLLLIIPNSSPVRLRLTNMELSSLSRSGYSSRANKTVYIFAYVYLGICVLAFLSYLIAGMGPFDAICHAFSVCATGGFSTRNASIGAFGSKPIEAITMVLMVLASCHFGLIFLSIVGRTLKPLSNPVLKFYLTSLAVFSVLTAVSLRATGKAGSFGESLWTGTFQTISVASTTGFAICDNSSWSMSTNMILMLMAIMCGCAGSTTGGIKADRVMLLLQSIRRQISSTLHPSAVSEIRMGRRVLRNEDVVPHLIYLGLYSLILAVSVILALMLGVNPHSSFAASISSLGNVGPAMAELGNLGNYGGLSGAAKLLFSLDMFLGRVEIYPIVAVLAMIFEKRKS